MCHFIVHLFMYFLCNLKKSRWSYSSINNVFYAYNAIIPPLNLRGLTFASDSFPRILSMSPLKLVKS